MDLISIVTINYNNSEGLQNTLISIEEQSYNNYELIIIDGNSTDNSIEVINCYNSIISKRIIENDTGIYNAMNKGLSLCKGEWLIFLNSGDVFYNKYVLNDFIGLLSQLSIKGDVFFGSTAVGNNIKSVKSKLSINDFILGLPFCHQSVFISKVIYENSKFNESLKIFGDLIYFRNLFLSGNVFVNLNQTISVYDLDGISSNFNFKYFQELFFINKDVYLGKFIFKLFHKFCSFLLGKLF